MKQECSRYQKGSYSHQNSSHDPKEKLDVSKGLKKSTNASVERINKHPKCKILLFKEVSKHHIAFLNSKFYQISYCRMDLASKTNKCLLLCINRKSTNEFHSFPTLTAVSTPNWTWNGGSQCEQYMLKMNTAGWTEGGNGSKTVWRTWARQCKGTLVVGWMLVYYGL